MESPNSGSDSADTCASKDHDRLLPIANVSRIMKKSLPPGAKISKEAKETVQECVSEFIIFITGEAADKCQREKRKTVNGDDLLWAMTTLGFQKYVGPLQSYLSKYRDNIDGEKGSMVSQSSESEHDHVGGPVAMATTFSGFDGGFYVEEAAAEVMHDGNQSILMGFGGGAGAERGLPSYLRGVVDW